ncbi:FAD-dependent oxidoreductase [bacterium]|nr:FAD-dependent oxidoreductase [bacterium]
MLRKLEHKRRSELEEIKDQGLTLDWDEISNKGKITAEEVQIAKWYGVYSSRQEGNHMARVVIPGGQFTAKQARALAKIAEDYAQGKINFTTRQSAQLHWLKLPMLAEFLRDIRKAELTTHHGCGDVTRNVAACPRAATCEFRRLNVLPYAQKTARVHADSHDLDNLPRKFKVSFSGCGAACGQPHINDVGVVAVTRRKPDGGQEHGFKVLIGGGMGWKAFVAQEVFSFVPPDIITDVTRAVGILFRDHGDRFNRSTSRLKFVVKRYGIEKCRELLYDIMREEGVDVSRIEHAPVEDIGPAYPARPLTAPGVGTDGLAIQEVMLPKGEMTHVQLLRLADLAEIYGDRHVYSSNRQNLAIHGVKPERIAELKEEIRRTGLGVEGFGGLRDIVPCVGLTYCPLAVSRTHSLYDLMQSVVHQEKYDSIRDAVLINITGCPNSCSPFRISDIGFRGMRIRENKGSVEGYELRLGGEEHEFGRIVGEYKVSDCVLVTARILDTFLAHRAGDETLSDNVRRMGLKPYRDAIGKLNIRYVTAPTLLENSAFVGHLAESRDFETIKKDVPCQEACPAKTNVPAYIAKIAQGDNDAAYRINQEDNVFPGVLGRVCTRPCESACRYNWTSTEAPVSICHLKRSAADRKTDKAAPLPAWFGPTGKRIAVIGGGPAGLTVARNLSRYGHGVTVHEREPYLGGLMRMGIPTFRLPRNVVDDEVNAIADAGIEVKSGVAVDRAKCAELAESFDAVVVATGAHRPQTTKIDGLPDDTAIAGLWFMKAYNEGNRMPVTGDVLVIGGGFTAVDCVRAARRIIGPDGGRVSMMYRRAEEHMSANREEIEQIRAEGIDIETCVVPVSARVDENGKLESVTFRRNLLKATSETGAKPEMIPIPGSEFERPCRTLILAIGQSRELEILPERIEIAGAHTTTHAKIFVTGDFAYGSLDVIHAVADAKAAADEIDEALMGEKRRERMLDVRYVDDQVYGTGRLRDMDLVQPPSMSTLDLLRRGFDDEVEQGFDDDKTQTHADRCYLCNYKYEIDQDRCIHCDWCLKVMPRDCIHKVSYIFQSNEGVTTTFVDTPIPRDATYIWIDSNECIRCGACLRVCPTEAISVRTTDIGERDAVPVTFVSGERSAAFPTRD